MKKFLREFKSFALRGNVLDLAVGVLIGSAFQSIIAALTENVLSPIIGLFVKKNFDDLAIDFLGVTLTYGKFISAVMNFIIVAFIVFLIVRLMNKLTNLKKSDILPTTKDCPYCKTEISIAAIRCPNCTSELPDLEIESIKE